MTISRWEPVGNPRSMHEAAQHLFDHHVWQSLRPDLAMAATPMDVSADGDGYVVELALPGVKPEDLDMQLTGTRLTISGEFKRATAEGRRYLLCQRQAGPFQATVTLRDAADAAQVTATFEHGVLRVEVPKSEASKPKRITLQPAT